MHVRLRVHFTYRIYAPLKWRHLECCRAICLLPIGRVRVNPLPQYLYELRRETCTATSRPARSPGRQTQTGCCAKESRSCVVTREWLFLAGRGTFATTMLHGESLFLTCASRGILSRGSRARGQAQMPGHERDLCGPAALGTGRDLVAQWAQLVANRVQRFCVCVCLSLGSCLAYVNCTHITDSVRCLT